MKNNTYCDGPGSDAASELPDETVDVASSNTSLPDSKPPIQPDPDSAGDELPLDDLFSVLRNSRRRRALRYLLTKDDRAATVGELSEYIASIENDTDVTLVTSKQRKRVYIGLYQTHLPKLATLGVIDYERNRGRVLLLDGAEQFEPYLSVANTETARERWAAAGLAVGHIVLVGFLAVNYSLLAAIISLIAGISLSTGVLFYLSGFSSP